MGEDRREAGTLSEREWLAAYDPRAYDPVAVTCDVVILTLRGGGRLHVLLVRRGKPPFAGSWALPGGFVQAGAESLDRAAARELAEETGLDAETGIEHIHLEQLASYGNPDRDPRMHVVTIAYLAFAPDLPDPQAGSDASAAAWIPVDDLALVADQANRVRYVGAAADGGETAQPHGEPSRPPVQDRRTGAHGGGPARRSGFPGGGTPLAFDHGRILADGLERARSKIEYTPLATAFLGEEFTISELRAVYEAVWGTRLHAGNFHRKVLSVPGFVESTGATADRGGSRGGPRARLYRAGDARLLHPALLRPDREDTVR